MIVCDFCGKENNGLEYQKRGGKDLCEYCVRDFDKFLGEIDKAHLENKNRLAFSMMELTITDKEILQRRGLIK